MTTNRLLIGSAMLTALCEEKQVDNLNLLENFVTICIHESFSVNSVINKQQLHDKLFADYPFANMPMPVLEKILKRISSRKGSFLTNSGDDDYLLTQDLSEKVGPCLAAEASATQDIKDVVDALDVWFKAAQIGKSSISEELENVLADYFDTRGVDVLFDTDELRGDTQSKNDHIAYQIGRFILNAQENDPVLFHKIENIATGSMIASAIFVDTGNIPASVKSKRLTEVDFYLDTPIVLCALNYKLPEQKKIADSMLDMLRENGANLFVLPQHLSEIKDILRSFRDRDGESSASQTLEGFDADITSIEIDREIRRLPESLKALGINISPSESDLSRAEKTKALRNCHIDYVGLKQYLTDKIDGYSRSPKMLENDADAISYIINRRNNVRYEAIESCCAIFVSSNPKLIKESNQYLHYAPYKLQIPPTISDTDLSSIVWVKYAMRNKSVSRLRLVEYAHAAIAPSHSVMSSFFSVTKRLAKNGSITDDDAAEMRYSAYARAEVMTMCGGDAEAIDDESVLAIHRRVTEKYMNKGLLVAEKAVRRAEASESALISRDSNIRKQIGELRKDADADATRFASHCSSLFSSVLKVLLYSITAYFLYITAINKKPLSMQEIALALFSAASVIAMFIPQIRWCDKLKTVLQRKLFDWKYAHNIKKIDPEISRLRSLLEDSYESK